MLICHLQEQARRYPRKIAVVHGERRLTYDELYRSALALGGRLRDEGIGEGGFVYLLLPNSADFVVACFAVAAVRGVAILMDPWLTDEERSRYLDDITPGAVIVDSRLRKNVPAGCPQVPPEAAGASGDLRPGSPYPGPVLCQFSSGSTGLSKRVVRTQHQLLQEYRQLADAVTLADDDAVAAVVPLHHAHGFGNAMLLALCNGLRLVIPQPPRDDNDRDLPLRFWRRELLTLLASERVTILPAVPFVFGLLAEAPEPYPELCLRLCISAGSRLTEDTYRRFLARFGVPVRQLYGCTEAGSVTLNTDEDVDATWQSAGKPLPGVEVRLEGEDGAVAFRSSALSQEIHEQGAAADEVFRDAWFRPGDIGRFDENGRLYILGRQRPFIETGGFKIDPREVERVLCGHPGVAEAIVFGVPHPSLEETIKAVVVPRPGISLDKKELADLCSAQLAAYKRPRALEVRDSLPRSPLGKVLVRELI